jgi:hypothetical protein
MGLRVQLLLLGQSSASADAPPRVVSLPITLQLVRMLFFSSPGSASVGPADSVAEAPFETRGSGGERRGLISVGH